MLILFIGFIAGIIGGMGIGGGTILIPSLIIFTGTKQHIAQSVNLIAFIPTAIVAILIHLKKRNIEVKLIAKLIVFGCIGSLIGSLLAVNINPNILKKIFGVFLFVMGLYEIFAKNKNKRRTK